MKYSFIAIEGNIGAGKSTLASKLALQFRAELLEESFEENPLLPSFYLNPEEFAYPLELSFLLDRFRDVKRKVVPGRPVICDYWFNKSLVFAKANLRKDQFLHFEQVFQQLEFLLPVPDLVIYYHRSIDRVRNSIMERGRTYEQGMSEKYLLKVEKGYLSYIKKYKKSPVLWLEGDAFAPGRNRDHMSQLLSLLDAPLKPGLNRPEFSL